MPVNLPLGIAYIEFNARTKRIDDRLERMERRMSRLTQVMLRQSRASRELKQSTEAWGASLRKLVTRGGPLLAAYFTLRNISGAITNIIRDTDRLVKTADAIGISVDYLQSLRFAADRSGVGIDTLDRSLAAFAKRLGEARVNTGVLYYRLERLNPGLLKLITHSNSVEQAIQAVWMEALQMGNAFDRANLLAAAFGRIAGPAMQRLAKENEELVARAEELGLTYGDLARNSEILQDRLTNIRFLFKATVDKAVLVNWEELNRLLTKTEGLMVALAPKVVTVSVSMGQFVERFHDLVEATDFPAGGDPVFLKNLSRTFKTALEITKLELENVRKGFEEATAELTQTPFFDPSAEERLKSLDALYAKLYNQINRIHLADAGVEQFDAISKAGTIVKDATPPMKEHVETLRSAVKLYEEGAFNVAQWRREQESQRLLEHRAARDRIYSIRLANEQAAVQTALNDHQLDIQKTLAKLDAERLQIERDKKKIAEETDPALTPTDFIKLDERLKILNAEYKEFEKAATNPAILKEIERHARSMFQLSEETKHMAEFMALAGERAKLIQAPIRGARLVTDLYTDAVGQAASKADELRRLTAQVNRQADKFFGRDVTERVSTAETQKQLFILNQLTQVDLKRQELQRKLRDVFEESLLFSGSDLGDVPLRLQLQLQNLSGELGGLEQKALKFETEILPGLAEGFKLDIETVESLLEYSAALDKATRAAQKFEQAFVNAMTQAIFHAGDFGQALQQLLTQLAQLVVQQQFLQPLANAITSSSFFAELTNTKLPAAPPGVGEAAPRIAIDFNPTINASSPEQAQQMFHIARQQYEDLRARELLDE